MTFPESYPFTPPVLLFNPVVYHPMIVQEGKDKGQLCLPILGPEKYKPAIKVSESIIIHRILN